MQHKCNVHRPHKSREILMLVCKKMTNYDVTSQSSIVDKHNGYNQAWWDLSIVWHIFGNEQALLGFFFCQTNIKTSRDLCTLGLARYYTLTCIFIILSNLPLKCLLWTLFVLDNVCLDNVYHLNFFFMFIFLPVCFCEEDIEMSKRLNTQCG